LSPSPIGKVPSTLRKHRVRALLMGGQACILYGAAEFSCDIDVVVLAEPRSVIRLQRALAELQDQSTGRRFGVAGGISSLFRRPVKRYAKFPELARNWSPDQPLLVGVGREI